MVNAQFLAAARASNCRVLNSIDLIVKIAFRYPNRPHCLGFDDLVQEGIASLLVAEPSFDETRGEWRSFAVFAAKNGMREAILRSKFIRLPRDAVKNQNKIADLASEGRSAKQIAEELSLPINAVKSIQDRDSYNVEAYVDMHASTDCPETSQEAEAVVKEINKLPKGQREAVTGRVQGRTLKELAEEMGVTTQTVSYHEKLGLKRLEKMRT